MELKQFRYVCTVAEKRSMTKAADSLYITQPSLSHFIARTEEELGVTLFNRNTFPISLTDAGEIYVETAKAILNQYDQMQKKLHDISRNFKGRIRIGMAHDRAAFLIPLAVPKFKSEFPGFNLQFRTAVVSNLYELLRSGDVEAIIIPNAEYDKNVFSEADICEEKLLLVAKKGTIRKEYLWEGKKDCVDLRKLKDLPFILLQPEYSSRAKIDAVFKSMNFEPTVTLETNSNLTSYMLAAAGVGVTIVPDIIPSISRVEPDVDLLEIRPGPVKWKVQAIYLKNNYSSIVERRLFEIIKEVSSTH